jgi:hypothetical protein
MHMTDRSFTLRNLCTWKVVDDGTRLLMSFVCEDGSDLALDLPTESLNSLIMTLPAMVTSALRRRYLDETLRLVYPAAAIDIEQASDKNYIIVTFKTPDGFAVSFSITQQQMDVFVSAADELDRRRACPRAETFN